MGKVPVWERIIGWERSKGCPEHGEVTNANRDAWAHSFSLLRIWKLWRLDIGVALRDAGRGEAPESEKPRLPYTKGPALRKKTGQIPAEETAESGFTFRGQDRGQDLRLSMFWERNVNLHQWGKEAMGQSLASRNVWLRAPQFWRVMTTECLFGKARTYGVDSLKWAGEAAETVNLSSTILLFIHSQALDVLIWFLYLGSGTGIVSRISNMQADPSPELHKWTWLPLSALSRSLHVCHRRIANHLQPCGFIVFDYYFEYKIQWFFSNFSNFTEKLYFSNFSHLTSLSL